MVVPKSHRGLLVVVQVPSREASLATWRQSAPNSTLQALECMASLAPVTRRPPAVLLEVPRAVLVVRVVVPAEVDVAPLAVPRREEISARLWSRRILSLLPSVKVPRIHRPEEAVAKQQAVSRTPQFHLCSC